MCLKNTENLDLRNKMLSIAFVLIFGISGVLLQYVQNDFSLTFEYAEKIQQNPEYYRQFKVVSFKYNRTSAAINQTIEFKRDLDNNLKIEVQAYKFASNEYRPFPLRFSFNFCDAIKKNDFGMKDIYKCGNLTKCPMKKGNYLACNWAPNGKRFPPFIPEGKWMLDIKYFIGVTEIAFIRAYGIIKKINKWELVQATN